MPKAVCSDDDLKQLVQTLGVARAARAIGLTKRAVDSRRRAIEKRTGQPIITPTSNGDVPRASLTNYPHRAEYEVKDGIVLVGSDAHIWPGHSSPALRGFRLFAKEFRPKIIVLNGDVLDFPQISRHDPIGWEGWPSVKAELEAAQDELHELALAAPKAEKVWTLGNHDARFESRLANAAPEFARVHGVHLRDHFPVWRPAWAAWVNNEVVIKHRFKGGVHATHNNAVASGKTFVTGHLHSAKVTPYTDYNGTRYGVDTGCLADPDAKAFVNYTEDNPKNWRAAFGILTFKGGKLLPPELAQVWDDKHITFRGELIRV